MSLIIVIVLMLLFALLGAVITALVAGDSDLSLNQQQSSQAFYLAEAGLAYGFGQLGSLPDCAASTTTVSLGGGAFDVCQEATGVPGQTRIRSVGRVNSPLVATVQRVAEVIVTSGGTSEAVSNGDFDTDISGWTPVITNNEGSSQWSNDPTTGGDPGSLLLKTDDCFFFDCAGKRFRGYLEQSVSIPSGVNATLQLDYCKHAVGSTGSTSSMDVSVEIVYAGGGTPTVWSDTSQPSNPNCDNFATWNNGSPPGAVNVTFPTTDTVTTIRLVFDLRNRGGFWGIFSQKFAWFDSVSLTYGGGSPAMLSWKEVYVP